jgi:hypothetical protein
MREAKTVTIIEATISGNMPNSGGSYVGYQNFPKRKSLTEISLKMGIPSLKRNSTIRVKTKMDVNATSKNRF